MQTQMHRAQFTTRPSFSLHMIIDYSQSTRGCQRWPGWISSLALAASVDSALGSALCPWLRYFTGSLSDFARISDSSILVSKCSMFPVSVLLFWETRVEICRDRHDQRSCKICSMCVNFSGKQHDFWHNLRWTTKFTHSKCDFTMKLLKIYTQS